MGPAVDFRNTLTIVFEMSSAECSLLALAIRNTAIIVSEQTTLRSADVLARCKENAAMQSAISGVAACTNQCLSTIQYYAAVVLLAIRIIEA